MFIINSNWVNSKKDKMVDFTKKSNYNLKSYGLNLAQQIKEVVITPETNHKDIVDFLSSKGYPEYYINWGNSELPNLSSVKSSKMFLNRPEVLKTTINKLTLFKSLTSISDEYYNILPEFSTKKEDVTKWLDSKERVYCRTKLTGHSGDGIIVLDYHNDISEIPDAPLYTKRFRGDKEFRFSLAVEPSKKVIDILQKRKLSSEKLEERELEANKFIKNNSNGYIYSHEVDIEEGLIILITEELFEIMQVLGVSFTAADVIFNSRTKEWKLLELNSSPGIEGTHFEKWVSHFKQLLGRD
jgi:hypothetical protein